MTNREKLVQKVLEWSKKVVAVGATYSNSGVRSKYSDFLKQKKPVTNCALGLNHAISYAGVIPEGWTFYSDINGVIKGSAKIDKLSKIATFTHYAKDKKVKLKDIHSKLKPSSIIFFYGQHTVMFYGKENGQYKYLNFGTGTTVGKCAGSYWKSMIDKEDISHYVSYVMNFTDEALEKAFGKEVKETKPTKPTTVEPTTTTTYLIQCGAYKLKLNANLAAKSITKKTGFATLVNKDENTGLYIVQCGAFMVKENADNRLKELKKKKVDAFIKEV